MKKYIIALAMFGTLSITHSKAQIRIAETKNPADYVNPMIGTGGHGHTYPGAVYPFGMVQLSPDTRLEGWDGCSGYHYSDSVIYGFSHTHLSGTGVSDYADILIMPVGAAAEGFYPADIANYPFKKSFNKKDEIAKAGYYSVKAGNVYCELTAGARYGVHRYSYTSGSKNQKNGLYLDLSHRDIVHESYLKFISPTEIGGYRRSKAWAENQQLYFYIKFSSPYQRKVYRDNKIIEITNDSINGKNLKAMLEFASTKLEVKVSISAVSIANAKLNLETECGSKSFDDVKNSAYAAWNKELSKIVVSDPDENKLSTFYTALYHCMIVPNLYSDVNGEYLGRDFKKHTLKDKRDYYTVFSLWDTYRAYHPLMTIIDRQRTSDFINTFLLQYQQGGELPVWEFASNETYCMIGYHSVPVIADAIQKNIEGFDYTLALKAMKHSSNLDHFGLKSYREFGYIPMNYEAESVSRTLEYAFDDYCIAKTAEKLNDTKTAKEYFLRAQYYKNIFEPEGGFFRPKSNGSWLSPFDPREVTFHYTEANAWQYNFYVPQDIETHIKWMGGNEKYQRMLEYMFNQSSQTTGRDQADITGLIGQYAHGNEPSHHMAYLFNYCGSPWKTSEIVDSVLKSQYHNAPDGLSGNEDCGQMSAWYVLSSIGFYPVNPADSLFVFGRPYFSNVSISLENGNMFKVKCLNQSAKNKYIKNVTLNGVPYPYSYISYSKIMQGGQLEFEMGDKPNKTFAQAPEFRPRSILATEPLVIVPLIKHEKQTFTDSLTIPLIDLNSKEMNSDVYFSLDFGKRWEKYQKPLIVKNDIEIWAKAVAGKAESKISKSKFIKAQVGRKVSILSTMHPQYTAGGAEGIIDNIRGGADFRTGGWQGYQGQDFEAIVDLGKIEKISKLGLGCLQDCRAWVLMPTEVMFFYSLDGQQYLKAAVIKNPIADTDQTLQIHDFQINITPTNMRYVKVVAINYGKLPSWHLGSGGDSYIFIDEIIIK